MNRIQLRHLTIVGKNRPPATVTFGEKLTVIHGSSESGKTYIYEAIQFVLGFAKELKQVPEDAGYQEIMLGLETQAEGAITLTRNLNGGPIGLYQRDVRAQQTERPDQTLTPAHVSKTANNVSRSLLARIGMDNQFVRTDQFNTTRMLRLRDVMHLVSSDETKILAKTSPIEFGQHSDKTVESSIFKLLLEGTDDSGLIPLTKPAERKKIAANKTEILDKVIADLEERLRETPPIDALQDQLARLNNSLSQATTGIETTSSERDSLVADRSTRVNEMAEAQKRLAEVNELIARFSLLDAQYQSDLDRLDLLAQVGRTLGVVAGESCPFCGAAESHQHWASTNNPADKDGQEHFASAVRAEQAKIRILKSDLNATMADLAGQQQTLESAKARIDIEVATLTVDIRRREKLLTPRDGELSKLIQTKSQVEASVGTHRQVLELLALRSQVAVDETEKTVAGVKLSPLALTRFETCAQQILSAWRFPDSGIVQYSTEKRDLVVGHRARGDRGKGVRSVLHALFNIALAEYCLKEELRHPGFVLLDSPIVTYRQPDEPARTGEDETVTTTVVDAFYDYLQNSFSGQSIIVENTSPVSPLPDGATNIYFTGNTGLPGRAGFYPPQSASVETARG